MPWVVGPVDMNISSHPSTLVIGDIHHRTDFADKAIKRYSSRGQRTVFLGDYFDAFGDGTREMRATCQWLRRSLKDPNRTHLLGNHDLAYLMPLHHQAWCPGWTSKKQQVFDEEMAGIGISSFRIACQVGPWLLSHAGVDGEHLDELGSIGVVEQLERELARACSGSRSWLFDRSPERGGLDRAGAVLWADWREFALSTPVRIGPTFARLELTHPLANYLRGGLILLGEGPLGWGSRATEPGKRPAWRFSLMR